MCLVHDLHPYQGRFSPRIPAEILKNNFSKNQRILDPFVGSGTTLLVANQMGRVAVGIDNSAFACMLSRAKLESYDFKKVQSSANKLSELILVNKSYSSHKSHSSQKSFLSRWFLPQITREILFLNSQIQKEKNQKIKQLFQIVLSRSMHSCLRVPHSFRGELRRPVPEKYFCSKHQKFCHPPTSLLPFFQRYLIDTISALQESHDHLSRARWQIIHADSRNVAIPGKFHGVITSPPYMGQIDYQKDHAYAFETFNLKHSTNNEIGSRAKGRRENARKRYISDIAQVLNNCQKYLLPGFKILLVFNDHYQTLEKILSRANLKIVDVSDCIKSHPSNKKDRRCEEKIIKLFPKNKLGA